METTEEIISKSVECCSEFLCGECPYNKYEDKQYIFKCVHMLMKDIDRLFKSKHNQTDDSYADEESIEWLDGNEDEDLQDIMIRAARNAHFSRIKAKEEFQNMGILRVYNLGMKHMYDYLKKIRLESNLW